MARWIDTKHVGFFVASHNVLVLIIMRPSVQLLSPPLSLTNVACSSVGCEEYVSPWYSDGDCILFPADWFC
uniref:Uncharacterized protein n=1 Tax=Arundo donax TaxID=35708 RepID=A0A0A9FAJ2_ARUDO